MQPGEGTEVRCSLLVSVLHLLVCRVCGQWSWELATGGACTVRAAVDSSIRAVYKGGRLV
eukprot:3390630-Pleurochrysis_carterae.AAC.1